MKKTIRLLSVITLLAALVGCDLIEIKLKFTERDESFSSAYQIDTNGVTISDTSKLLYTLSDNGNRIKFTSKSDGTVTVTLVSSECAKKATVKVEIDELGYMTFGSKINEKQYHNEYYNSKSYSAWTDNPSSIQPQIASDWTWYTKNDDTTIKLHIKGDVIYCYRGCDKFADDNWYWVRGVILQTEEGKIKQIDWYTKGKLRVSSETSYIYYGESTYSGDGSGYQVDDNIKNKDFPYKIEGETLLFNGYAFTKGINPLID